MLQYVSEMISTSQTCLTPGEQVIKYCLTFLSKNCLYCAASLTTAAGPACRECGTLHPLGDCPVAPAVRNRLKGTVRRTFILFVRTRYSLLQWIFNVEAYMRKNHMKSAVANIEYRFPVFQILRKHIRLSTEIHKIQYIM
jgi:hypothetical protein